MTTVKIEQLNNRFLIDITGHAGFNPGNDIVCAAVSVLSQTLVQCIQDEEINGDLTINYLDLQDGIVNIDINYPDRAREKIMSALSVIITGFELLSNAYPDNVDLYV